MCYPLTMKKTISQTAKKLLCSVYELSRHRKIANMDGLIKILQGKIDEETLPLRKLKTFGLLISLKGKRAKMLFHQLVRNGYLDQKYIEGDYFLTLTKLGNPIAREFFEKITPNNKEKIKKKTILALRKGDL